MNDFIFNNSEEARWLADKLENRSHDLPDPSVWEAISEEFHQKTALPSSNPTLPQRLERLRQLSQVRTVRPVIAYGEPDGRLRWFIRKAIRKLVNWYVAPAVRDQNRFNQEVLDVVKALAERVNKLEEDRR